MQMAFVVCLRFVYIWQRHKATLFTRVNNVLLCCREVYHVIFDTTLDAVDDN